MKAKIRGGIDAFLLTTAVFFMMGAPIEMLPVPNLTTRWNGGNLTYAQPDNNGCHGVGWPVDERLAPNAPYADFWLSQRVHGCDYNHAAVDIVSASDPTILSPITGCVTKNGYDGVGNSIIIIDNDQYIITLLHGNYNIYPPDCVTRGQPIGKEASIGISSGPHTHLNIYDKICRCNINPMLLIK